MNERIKELAKQASYRIIETDGAPVISTEFDKEKFAELIVKECILIVKMGITRDGNNTEKYLRSMEHIRQIEKHFGVES